MSHQLGYLLILLGLFFPEAWAQAQVTTANIYIPFAAENGALQSALRASIVSSKDKTTVFAATCTAGPCTAIPGGSGTFTFTAGPETFVYSAAPNAQRFDNGYYNNIRKRQPRDLDAESRSSITDAEYVYD
ncbi:hypothetical protein SAPIO_CDS8243 [Scedosporium apiospermum]|uniref:Uncharacterized protein n=1 Tax=Pseudallescheria apiosperma TaxID=563466 RepID=A0A084FZ74_PSEDA|nr:uncharacterized protein SAPIO_CDS8243 [Scedosporium apiospermum]KEZ40386.1 hypothetical protein SAPIO_CDS8243 [Scedosporium apiospermum]